jgi:peptidoglycan/xylan/chitin deacetylase (PgdA/CDA1 family)
MHATSDDECLLMMGSLSHCLRTSDITAPQHRKTMSIQQLIDLIEADVFVENHGWGHCNYNMIDECALLYQVIRARDWLNSMRAGQARAFAVPFGKMMPSSLLHDEFGTWFLSDRNRLPGPTFHNVYNKASIDCPEDIEQIQLGKLPR